MDPLLWRFLNMHAADLGIEAPEATVDTLSASDKDVLIERLLKYSDDVEKTKFRSAFTLVLVDGDALNFRDDLVRGGIPGGEAAAERFMKAILDEYKYEADFDRREAIMIKIYANVKGLTQTYNEQGVASASDFENFMTGFNKVFPLCEFIDAGNAKDGADRKIQETMTLFLYNTHCRRIVLGAPTDNTYASYLKKIYDFDVPSKVSLLKGPPFALEFQEILHRYRQMEFTSVFRDEKLPGRYSPPTGKARPSWTSMELKRKADGSPDGGWKRELELFPGNAPSMFRQSDYDERRPQVAASSWRSADTWRPNHSSSAGAVNTRTWRPAGLLEGATSGEAGVQSTTSVASPPQQPSGHSSDPLSIERALIIATFSVLNTNPRSCNFGTIKRLAEAALGLEEGFWGSNPYNPWFERSKQVIKWATEHWMERTNSPPPGNATWLLQYFSPAVAPAVILRSPGAQYWRTQGEDSWLRVLDGLDG